nr:MAG TPA: hypothetical protein [Caudoviricetes sp.]
MQAEMIVSISFPFWQLRRRNFDKIKESSRLRSNSFHKFLLNKKRAFLLSILCVLYGVCFLQTQLKCFFKESSLCQFLAHFSSWLFPPF